MLQRWVLYLQLKKGKQDGEIYMFPMHLDDTGLTMLTFSKGGKAVMGFWDFMVWHAVIMIQLAGL